MGRDSEPRVRSRTASRSEPSVRSTPSERSIRSHRVGQSHEEWQAENGLAPKAGDQKAEAERYERMRAEAAAAGKKPYCPLCRSGNIRYLRDGSLLCVGRSTSRGKPCCDAQGLTTVFTAKEAREAGGYWLSDLKSSPE